MTREEFFSQEKISVEGVSGKCAPIRVYKQADTKQIVYEIDIDAGLDETIEIGMVTDLHFNYANKDDLNDPEIAETVKYRTWLKDGESVPYAINALKGAALLDQIVVCGDTFDYLSKGAMELTKKYIFNPYPDSLCVLGGHELTKQMQTGKPDLLPLSERLAVLENFWLHDAHYVCKLVKNKVACIGLDVSTGHYYDGTYERLAADIESARRNGYVILIFQHEPVNTRCERYRKQDSAWEGDPTGAHKDFCEGKDFIGSALHDTEEDKKVYSLITTCADVIKGVFAGHLHNLFYNEIVATKKDGGLSSIPQLIVPANPYVYGDSSGQLTRIIVK